MLPIIFLLITYLTVMSTIQIGRVYQARLVTISNSTWLYAQINANACICTTMTLFNTNFLALNYFSSNQSCQIFHSSINSPELVSSPNSTLILGQPLPNPCCSNLTWLLTRIQRAQKPSSVNVQQPTFLSINSANQLLSVMSYQGSRTLLNPANLTAVVNTTSVGSTCAIASQYGSLFISSCDNPDTVRIYNETQSGLQLRYILNSTNLPRQVVFVLNNTWLLISIQYVPSIDIFSVNLTTNTFQYNQSIIMPYSIIWSLTKQNDTLIYVCFWKTYAPVYTLSYNGLSWILASLPATQTSTGTLPAQVGIDSCGRLWVAVYGFGIRIYDATGHTLLANWSSVSTGIATLLVLDNYAIYLGDYDNNKIYYYAPNLQCTS